MLRQEPFFETKAQVLVLVILPRLDMSILFLLLTQWTKCGADCRAGPFSVGTGSGSCGVKVTIFVYFFNWSRLKAKF